MRKQIIEKTIYKFDELSERAQERALEKLYDINVDYDWWDSVYDDARRIGLKLKYFDLDRHRHCTGELIKSPLDVIELIKADHGEDCETYKTAQNFEQCFRDYADAEAYDDRHQDDDDFEQRFDRHDYEDSRDEFEKALLEDYSIILQHEYDYLTSREAILESIEVNEYEFDEDGNLA